MMRKQMSRSQTHTTLMLHLPPRIAEVSRKTIEKLGHRALVIRKPAEALGAAMKRQPVALFVFRIQDPNKDCSLFQKVRTAHPRCQGIALLSPRLKGEFPLFRAHAYPDHLIPDKTPMEYSDIAVTIGKALSRDIFGMEKYGIEPHTTLRLAGSFQKKAVVRKIGDYFRKRGVPERAIQKIVLILDELIMNAIFDAPVNRGGKKLFYGRPRSSSIRLKTQQRPKVAYGLSKDAVAVSVSDPFGGFNKSTFFSIMNRLRTHRSIRRGPGKGAGMGLFMIFRALDEMIVNVAPGRRTEFIGLLYLRKKAGTDAHQRRALHFFQLKKGKWN